MGPLLERFRALAEDADEATIEALAGDVVALLPPARPAIAGGGRRADDGLLGDRLSPSQRRCLHRFRALEAPPR